MYLGTADCIFTRKRRFVFVIGRYAKKSLTQGLIVESHQLTARVPEDLRHEVGGVQPRAAGKDATDLPVVVLDELDGVLLQPGDRVCLLEGRHLVRAILS